MSRASILTLLGAVAILQGLAVNCVFSDDTAAYLKLKAAAAIAMNKKPAHSPTLPDRALPPPTPKETGGTKPVVAGSPTSQRLIVYRLHARWCGPCQSVGAALTPAVRSTLPFEIVDWDVDERGYLGASSIPAFRWNVNGKQWGFEGFYGVNHLLSEWKKTTANSGALSAQQKPGAYPQRNAYWSGPDGNHPFRSHQEAVNHLLNHGLHRGKFTSQTLHRMSLQELNALHSDDHENAIKWKYVNN